MHYFWLRPCEERDWTDLMLLDSMDESIKSPYHAYYPDSTQSISVGMLPRLTRALSTMGWFVESNSNKDKPMIHLFLKAVNKICAIRNWKGIMQEYSENADGIVEILAMCLLASMLRMYPHADECPTMDAAVELFHRFTVDIREASYSDWCQQHGTIVWFALREYQLWLVRLVDALYWTLTRATNLPAVLNSVSAGLDHACRIYNHRGAYEKPEANIFSCKMLHVYYYTREQLKWTLRVQRVSFLNMMRMVLGSMWDQIYTNNEQYCYTDVVSDEMRDTMKWYISKLDPNDQSIFQLHHMVHWGIDHDVLDGIFDCKQKFELDGAADHHTKRDLEMWLFTNPRNFHRIHMLVTFMFNHCQIEFVPLSKQMAEAQERALRMRLKVPAHRTLTTTQITDFYCPVCKRLCATIAPMCWGQTRSSGAKDGSKEEKKVSTFNNVDMPRHIGHEGVKWDPLTDKLLCRKCDTNKAGSFQDCKKEHLKQTGASLLYKGGSNIVIRSNSASREACKERFVYTGRTTEVVPVCLIGAGLRIGQQIVVLCTQDAAKTYLSLETWGAIGPSCTAHVNDPFAFLRPQRKLYSRVGPIPVTFNPNDLPNNVILASQGLNWDQLEQKCWDANYYSGAFGLMEKLDAILNLRNGRSTAVADHGAPVSVSPLVVTTETRGKKVFSFSLGSMTTYAKIGNNSYVDEVKKMQPSDLFDLISKHNHDMFQYQDRCILCKNKRPKSDGEWGMSVAKDESQRSVIIFICPKDRKRLFPSIAQHGVFELYGLRQLGNFYHNEVNVSKPGQRFYTKKQ